VPHRSTREIEGRCSYQTRNCCQIISTGNITAARDNAAAPWPLDGMPATGPSRRPGARRLARIAVSRWRWPGTHYTATRSAAAWIRPLFPDPTTRAALLAIDDDLAALP
jgi:hypothetical protein